MLYCHFISPLKCVIIMKPNVNPVTLYTKKERTRKANTLCKTKLEAVAVQVATSGKLLFSAPMKGIF